MKKIEKVSIIGLGAIGASYLACMVKKMDAGEISVIASGERAERYRADGVTVNDSRILFNVVDPKAQGAPADLLIFAVKQNDLTEAIADAANQVGPETIIISLLNGITSEEEIAAAYGWSHTLLSTVTGIAATRVGSHTSNSKLGVIQFGDAAGLGEGSEEVRLVRDFFDRTGITYEIHRDMTLTLWKKFMLNAGMNQTSAILGFPYGMMHRVEPARAIAVSAMKEVIELAALEGIPLTEDEIAVAFARIDGLTPTGKTSMLQDVEAKRPTEVAMLGETVVRMGAAHGRKMPVNETLSRLIRSMEAAY